MSSERPGQRDKIAKTVAQMVKGGADPRYAKAKATQSAIRDDRRKSAKQ
jgi:hypothetical protein